MTKRLGNLKAKRRTPEPSRDPPKKAKRRTRKPQSNGNKQNPPSLNIPIEKAYQKVADKKPPDKIKFYSIKEKLPPDDGTTILFFDPMFGYEIGVSAIVRQHIHRDIETMKFSRTTYWAKLKTKESSNE